MLQGRCKPSAIELALIAKVQTVLAVFDRKVTNCCRNYQISGIYCIKM